MASARFPQLVRCLSTSSSRLAAADVVKAPIQLFGLEGRYAMAAYAAATRMKQLDAVERELVKLQASLKTDPKLREFVKNPTLKRSVKAEALKHLAAKMSLAPATGNLLELLAENGRLAKVDGVIEAFKTIMSAHRGEVVCEVTTAKALDDAQRKNLEATLKKFLKSNEVLQLTAKVNPAILGGMIVSIGDRYVDMSVASKVKRYTEIIQAAA